LVQSYSSRIRFSLENFEKAPSGAFFLYTVNMKYYPAVVVDNFYQNPDQVRNFALNQKYYFCSELDTKGFTFPGARSADLAKINPSLFSSFTEKACSLYHNFKYDDVKFKLSSSFQFVTKDFGKGVIHQDNKVIFAGVIYLSPYPKKNSGTSLFKKNSKFTLDRYNQSIEKNNAEFRKGNFIPDTSYHDMFDEFLTANNHYNSLIMYEGDIFHCANDFFGDNLNNSRLAQVFFVHEISGKDKSAFPVIRNNSVTEKLL